MILSNHHEISENKSTQDKRFRANNFLSFPVSPCPLRPPCHHGIRNAIWSIFTLGGLHEKHGQFKIR